MVGEDRIPDRLSANRIACRLPMKIILTPGSTRHQPEEQGLKAFNSHNNAAARLLSGRIIPRGHLPVSWEKKLTDNPSYDSYYPDEKTSLRCRGNNSSCENRGPSDAA